MPSTTKSAVTKINSVIYETKLEWEIKNFAEFQQCEIDKITSEIMNFESGRNLDINWCLIIIPRSKATGNVDLKLKIKYPNVANLPFEKLLLSIHIEVEKYGNDMMSPANRHLVKKKGIFAEPEHNNKSAQWIQEFKPLESTEVTKNSFYEIVEFEKMDFIHHEDLKDFFLSCGALKIHAKIAIKTVKVVNESEVKEE